MTFNRVRSIGLLICAVGIAGIIVSTIRTENNLGWVLSFGGLAALSSIIVVVAFSLRPTVTADDEILATQIEDRVTRLVQNGTSEPELRSLITDAVRFGRARADRT